MKVILLADVKKIGKKNEIKEVNDGYARNSLIPNKKAIGATPNAIQNLKNTLGQKADSNQKADEAEHVAKEKLSGKTVTLKTKTSESGSLFKKVGEGDIQKVVRDQFGINISNLSFSEIKHTGDHKINFKSKNGQSDFDFTLSVSGE